MHEDGTRFFMRPSNKTGALLAGLAWLPWSEDPSGECPAAIIRFFESLNIDVSVALSRSSRQNDLTEWLKNQFGHSRQQKVRWFEVGIRTMVASRMLAHGAAPDLAEDALTAYQAVLQEAGVSLKPRERIAKIVRKMALHPEDQRIFARLLQELEVQARIQSPSAVRRPHSNRLASASYYMAVALVVTLALAGFSKNVPPLVLPLTVAAGLLLTTAIGGFGAFRD
jgi:hypothetical protein